MKPQWKDAPEWAKWLAMDKNGQWYWYEGPCKPEHDENRWDCDEGIGEKVGVPEPNWEDSLEAKPKEADHAEH
jgi:hypothetical protein